MAIEGKVRTLYTDKTQQEAIFPTTKVSAVTDDEGNGLNTLLEHIAYVDPTDMESAAVLANADTLGGYPASDYVLTHKINDIAAPTGYGLGGACQDIDSLDNAKETGFYVSGNGTAGGWWSCITQKINDNYIIQDAFCRQDDRTGQWHAKRTYDNGIWTVWEHVNPPMHLGVEYRTTERYDGKPVYALMCGCGSLPSASAKSFEHGIENIKYVISCTANAWQSNGTHFTIPHIRYADDPTLSMVYIHANTTHITLGQVGSVYGSAYYAYALMKYTKTTD